MPPKRYPKVIISQSNCISNSIQQPEPTTPILEDEDEIDDGREICIHDAVCYRKNPQHFLKYRHPQLMRAKKTGCSTKPTMSNSTLLKKTLSDDIVKMTSPKPQVDTYKTVLKSILSGTIKISSESKKMLRKIRNDQNISRQDHEMLLAQFGWSLDEYEDGERSNTEVDLEEERAVLLQPKGYELFTLKRKDKKTKEQEAVWSKASSQFYQTMSEAQSNYIIHSVSVICNTKVYNQYNLKKSEFQSKSLPMQEEWGFHGTSDTSAFGIASKGFLPPDKAETLGNANILDDGYFGQGIYFSLYSDYALWYSSTRGSNKILLCKILTGRVYKCATRMDGKGLMKGYDSHYSPKGNEIIVFNPDQILPRYIIEFEERDAEEREQEY